MKQILKSFEFCHIFVSSAKSSAVRQKSKFGLCLLIPKLAYWFIHTKNEQKTSIFHSNLNAS